MIFAAVGAIGGLSDLAPRVRCVILIDPPAWPAHGRLWSHLVSDSALDELHAFARSAGVSRRAFDVDHYDVPGEMYDDLVGLGALPLPARELLARLSSSGLRVRQADKVAVGAHLRAEYLTGHWAELGPALVCGPPEEWARRWAGIGAELLRRWSEPHRRYHDVLHLDHVLASLDLLDGLGEPVGAPVRVAAWFHDAVYDGRPGLDEQSSADLAASLLGGVGVPPEVVAEVVRLVLVTTPGAYDGARVADGYDGVGGDGGGDGSGPADPSAAVLVDADLSVLGAPPKGYAAYVGGVRAEYAHVDDAAFRLGRSVVLESLLARDRIYTTDSAYQRWEATARGNLRDELDRLTPGRSTSSPS